jgi:hypothetical protein
MTTHGSGVKEVRRPFHSVSLEDEEVVGKSRQWFRESEDRIPVRAITSMTIHRDAMWVLYAATALAGALTALVGLFSTVAALIPMVLTVGLLVISIMKVQVRLIIRSATCRISFPGRLIHKASLEAFIQEIHAQHMQTAQH